MSHARDLLNSVLSGPAGIKDKEELPSPLSATLVTKPPPITSVQAFNAQLTIGSKDESLRKAANHFKSAAESMERSRLKGEKYWVDALRIRRANWGLTPAPLPLGAATGKGADKTSKDFVISYGLEGCKFRFPLHILLNSKFILQHLRYSGAVLCPIYLFWAILPRTFSSLLISTPV